MCVSINASINAILMKIIFHEEKLWENIQESYLNSDYEPK